MQRKLTPDEKELLQKLLNDHGEFEVAKHARMAPRLLQSLVQGHEGLTLILDPMFARLREWLHATKPKK